MSLGNKIIDLRKKNGLSQEQLAEQMNITRQTISNWETEQTAPDINQAKELSKIFKISLDELLDNDISNIVIQKISNTEKLAGMIIKILKVGGILLLAYFVVVIVVLIIATYAWFNPPTVETSAKMVYCNLDNKNYFIKISSNGDYECSDCSKELAQDVSSLIEYNDIEASTTNITDYFIDKGGNCD